MTYPKSNHTLLMELREHIEAVLAAHAQQTIRHAVLVAACGCPGTDDDDCAEDHWRAAMDHHPDPPSPAWLDVTGYGAPDDLLRALADCLPKRAS